MKALRMKGRTAYETSENYMGHVFDHSGLRWGKYASLCNEVMPKDNVNNNYHACHSGDCIETDVPPTYVIHILTKGIHGRLSIRVTCGVSRILHPSRAPA